MRTALKPRWDFSLLQLVMPPLRLLQIYPTRWRPLGWTPSCRAGCPNAWSSCYRKRRLIATQLPPKQKTLVPYPSSSNRLIRFSQHTRYPLLAFIPNRKWIHAWFASISKKHPFSTQGRLKPSSAKFLRKGANKLFPCARSKQTRRSKLGSTHWRQRATKKRFERKRSSFLLGNN